MNELLDKANSHIAATRPLMNMQWYPTWHLAPAVGWMNDPNGLIWFGGMWHAFYQHHPYDATWGPMHWGHARSSDLIHWEHLPVALAPVGDADKDGCFSGSAVDNDGELSLIYTGHVHDGDRASDKGLRQVQCLATSRDGVNFTAQGKILDAPDGIQHFRDPKVWKMDDYWYMVVGLRVADRGEVRLWRSDDLHNWQPQGVLARSAPGESYMWECPDFFPLGDKWVLMFSPQGMKADGYHNRNLFQSGYLVGTWQPGGEFVIETPFIEIDAGHDFYAPQTLSGPDGRRLMLGWLDMWESPMPEKDHLWAGMLSMPRELTLKPDNTLRVVPAAEVDASCREPHRQQDIELKNASMPLMQDCEAHYVTLDIDLRASDAEKYGLSLGGQENIEQGLFIYVDNQSQRVVLERRYPQYGISGYRSVPVTSLDTLQLRVFFDRSSVEIFVNDGESCLSSRIYPLERQRMLQLFAQNGGARFKRVSNGAIG
ncbi:MULTISPECIES: glycoside hydrolase family 32 protein [unclassified Brenneria]|uniref:glycoside hydrolase family 32 protein n=1 Tax=unclassified Brenneria TaxID=2634434 RepID=UPI001557BAC1|nr:MULTISPECIES: glycoside hydrolase family 32 protein [unclassified Brenneria]MBJ7220966.1 glycoside hydrolase family 32 protein [Brenneria sp. L3-3C-1]MEE3642207.1 glycoside hydrolase family 32 protein [Brenneria sp. L3_3C_1]MEE3650421.1 glycoside hydrolase family 32 protein [Brenneria sp. HEZEL_4_2_4]NPD00377.1 glycoside hydrolase family 32 protein [Brenneria sp. hezel4-2-4]